MVRSLAKKALYQPIDVAHRRGSVNKGLFSCKFLIMYYRKIYKGEHTHISMDIFIYIILTFIMIVIDKRLRRLENGKS